VTANFFRQSFIQYQISFVWTDSFVSYVSIYLMVYTSSPGTFIHISFAAEFPRKSFFLCGWCQKHCGDFSRSPEPSRSSQLHGHV
jgi:hypothetical protein